MQIGVKMIHERITSNSHSQDTLQPEFEKNHHLPLYNIQFPWILYQNDILSNCQVISIVILGNCNSFISNLIENFSRKNM
jgi:hypothetical protein